MDKNICYRLTIKTNGIWKVNQISEALNSIDGLITRISVASKISETCQQFDYAISNLQAFGLLERGSGEKWSEAKKPDEIITRNDFIKLFSSFRNYGVEVSSKEFGLRFSFAVDDLLDIAPISNRPEIERITMCSPGEIVLLISGGLFLTQQAIGILSKIFDALKKKEEVKGNKLKNLYDYTVALDSFLATLRNAGFDNMELKKLLRNIITKDIDIISRYITLGNIENIVLKEAENEKPESE